MAKDERTFVGLYSGPSADGVEAAAVAVRDAGEKMRVRQTHFLHLPMPEALRQRVRSVAGGWGEPAASLAKLDRELGLVLAGACERLMREASLRAKHVAAVGMAGQLVGYVRASMSAGPGSVMELGSPAVVAEQTGLPVAAGFAASDLAAGGVGGPAWAWPDWLMFHDDRLSRVVVQLGAIATITFIGGAAAACEVVAYDTGPGTILIDAVAQDLFDRPFDADGALAARGGIHEPLLNELMAAEHFQRKAPKLASPGDWSGAAVQRLQMMAGKHRCSAGDLLTTVTELTARTVAHDVLALTERPHEVILAGGGARNIHLAGRIRTLLSPCSTYTAERYGLDLRAHAAVACAVLAAARLDAYPAHCAAATGAKAPVVLGAMWGAEDAGTRRKDDAEPRGRGDAET
jgi:anhydro-N-acetylmuramic acid kinase